ncbi:MAG: hypothetical protein ABJF50_25010 [Paracoccaceae bacterium]
MLKGLAAAIAVAALTLVSSVASAATITSLYFPTGVLAAPFINSGTNEAGINTNGDGYSGGTWTSTGTVAYVDPPPGTTDGQFRSPWQGTAIENTTGNYTAVQAGAGTSSAIVDFDQDQIFLFFLWGSGDTYNELSFWNEGVQQAVYTGADLNPADTTNITAVGSYLVAVENLTFDRIIFTTLGANAFEFANVLTGQSGQAPPVPLPPALILLFSALVGMGYLGRNKRRAAG